MSNIVRALLIGIVITSLAIVAVISPMGYCKAATKPQVVVVVYWARWCHACMQEVSQLNQFNRIKPSNVKFIGYDVDNSKNIQRADVDELGIQYDQVYVDPNVQYDLPKVFFLPTTMFIKNGKYKSKIVGGTTAQEILQRVNNL